MWSQKFFALAGGMDLVVLYLLLLLSITSLALIMERFLTLRKILKLSEATREKLKNIVDSNDFSSLDSVASTEGSLEARAIALVLNHNRTRGLSGVEELFNSYILRVRPDLERYLNFLATIGSNAPYIGLLGTVLGIMKAFHDLSSQSDAGMQSVMAGISSALLATAAGLFVAIPAVMAYNYFQRKVKSIIQGLELARDLAIVQAKTQEK